MVSDGDGLPQPGRSGRKLMSVLAVSGEALACIATRISTDPSRGEVVDALGGPARLADAAELIDRLSRAVRVM